MAALRILKLGDELYSESLQHVAPAYHAGFPQREQQLYGLLDDAEIVRLSHQRLLSAESRQGVAELVATQLREGGFDLVLIDNPLSMLVLGRAVPVPLVFDCIDWYEEMYQAEFNDAAGAALIRSCFGEAMRRADAIVGQSPVILDAACRIAQPSHQAVVPNGYNEELFRSMGWQEIAAARACLATRHDVDLAGRRILTYTGKIGRWYEGLRVVIEALDPERDLLFLVGDGPLLPELPRRDNVVRVGAVPLREVPLYSNAADLLVFPLGVDCSPIVVSEYLATGRPIVAPRGRLEWLLKDGVSGAVVDGTTAGWRDGFDRASSIAETARVANLRLAGSLTWRNQARRLGAFLQRVVRQTEERA